MHTCVYICIRMGNKNTFLSSHMAHWIFLKSEDNYENFKNGPLNSRLTNKMKHFTMSAISSYKIVIKDIIHISNKHQIYIYIYTHTHILICRIVKNSSWLLHNTNINKEDLNGSKILLMDEKTNHWNVVRLQNNQWIIHDNNSSTYAFVCVWKRERENVWINKLVL